MDRSLLGYWSVEGRLKESLLVVRFRILWRILDRRELFELLKVVELVLDPMQSDIAESGILGMQVDFLS